MTDYNLFIISPVEFENRQEDPFGFDNLSEKIASEYIPFSGTVRKPIYFLFVAYVKSLLQNEFAEYKNRKDKEEIKIRLEKLLVLSWKKGDRSLRGRNVIGNSIRDINPFKGNDGNWVVQNCHKIYASSASGMSLDTLVEEYKKNNLRDLRLIKGFLELKGPLNSDTGKYLKILLTNLRKGSNSLFRGKDYLPTRYSNKFFVILKQLIKKNRFGEDLNLMKKVFNAPRHIDALLQNVLNDSKYPFRVLNDWFCAFIQAVNADLDNETSKALWEKADRLFDQIKRRQIALRHDSLKNKRPHPRCWFDEKVGGYIKKDTFDESAWQAVLRRAESKDRFYSRFRTDALTSLLKELRDHEA